MRRLVSEDHIQLIPRWKGKARVVSLHERGRSAGEPRSADLLLGDVPVDEACAGKIVRVELGERLLVEGLLEVWKRGWGEDDMSQLATVGATGRRRGTPPLGSMSCSEQRERDSRSSRFANWRTTMSTSVGARLTSGRANVELAASRPATVEARVARAREAFMLIEVDDVEWMMMVVGWGRVRSSLCRPSTEAVTRMDRCDDSSCSSCTGRPAGDRTSGTQSEYRSGPDGTKGLANPR